MRLLRSKVYRAFPELDRFSDDQCARFVIAANSSWRRRAIRWISVGVVCVVGVVVATLAVIWIGTLLERHFHLRDISLGLIWALTAILGMAVPMVLGLVVKDQLLRRSIRRLIRKCGSCPRCHYSLLGMRVGADNTIICPECGTKVDVDPALGELSTDQTGAAVFKPEVAREHAATVAGRTRRHRAFFKWSAIGAASLMMLLSAAYGVWWWTLVEQAKTARAERKTTQRITELRGKMWPTGPLPESEQEWATFLDVLGEVQKREMASQSEKYQDALGRTVYFDFNAVAPGASAEQYEKNWTKGSFVSVRRLVLDVLDESRQAGTTERLRTLLTLRAPMRPLVWDESHPFFTHVIDGMAEARATARFNAARMALAMTNGDRGEYVEALEESLVLSRIVKRQGLLIEQLVGYAIDGVITGRVTADVTRFPDARWSSDVLAALLRNADGPMLAQSLEIERASGLDALQWFFGDPARVRNAQLGLAGSNDIFYAGGRVMPGSVGGYGANMAAMNGVYDGWVAVARRDVGARAVPSSTGFPIVDLVSPALGRSITSEQQSVIDFRRCVFAVAVQTRRLETGEYPGTFEEIAAIVPQRDLLRDPLSGKDYWFVPRLVKGENRTVIDVMTAEDDPAAKPGGVGEGAGEGAAKKTGP